MCVCILLGVYTSPPVADRDQIWHTHGDSSRNGNGRNKKLPCVTLGAFGGGGFRGHKITNLE